jgi:3-isopropylmalate/(R)-2-methylmalate dehydratase large subunit
VDGAAYQAIEFDGAALRGMSMDSRFTITNMAAEMGAKTGLMEIDDVASEWLKARRERPWTAFTSDEGARFSRQVRVDVSSLEPQVARPHSLANVSPVAAVLGTPIQQAVIGTCTNSRIEDLRAAAEILAGRGLSPRVRLFVTASSRAVFQQALAEGIIAAFTRAGAVLGPPGCGGCTGGSSFGIPADGMNVVSTANRNFQGRLGNGNASIYLASPATVMASAIQGEIADPRSYL